MSNSIGRLALIDSANGSTYFAININGQDYRLSMSELTEFLQGALSFPTFSGFVNYTTQYASPSSSGFSVPINNNSSNTHLILTPTTGFAAGTIVLPAIGNVIDKQEVLVNSTQQVTTLTINGNGAVAVTGEPTSLAADSFFRLKFDALTSTWYRVG